jgi:hypothetical protein
MIFTNKIKWGIALSALVTAIACGGGAAEKKSTGIDCGGSDCGIPPIAADAPEKVKQTFETLQGRWKYVSYKIRYEATKKDTTFYASKQGNLNNFFCFGTKGNISMHSNKELRCRFCYTLAADGNNVKIAFKNTEGAADWCNLQLENGALQVQGDSLILNVVEPLQQKRYVYRRVDEKGMLK